MSLVFFTDRDLGRQFPRILTEAGLTVERHDDHFAPDTRDEEWLAEIGRRGWTAITHDKRIRYKPNELAAVLEHQVRILVVVGSVPFADLARNFVATAPLIESFVINCEPPFIAKVYRPPESALKANPRAHGRVEHWYP